MAQPEVKVDMRDWERVMKGMHKADDSLRKEFRSELVQKMKKIRKDEIKAAGALSHVPHEVVAVLKRGMYVEVREKTTRSKAYGRAFSDVRVRFKSKKLVTELHGGVGSKTWPNPKSVVGMAKRTNSDKGWRHMAFGNKEVWYDQKSKPDWYDDTFNAQRPEVVKFINDKLREWKAKFGFRGFGF